MLFAGSSHGQLICCHRGYCLVVDVFTGAEVSPPRLPFSEDTEEFYYCGTLTAPITSPNSHLLISTQSSLFDWQAVHFAVGSQASSEEVNYRPYRLDMSTKPAKWVEVKKLENWALFIGGDARSPPFSFKNPERWGGSSNCLYYAHYSQPWSLHGLGDDADAVWDPTTDDNLVFKRNWYSQLQAFWVYPSMFYSDGDGQ
ncbi:hypothetical protein E2562_016294 [Oryza meyeriana var. granulata]|uniref:DUF295 domain-containing protein n=1 Tax=Oryza meyeriana var. granulata TaxID=110450 RepID=A0A6G1CQY1_9ORYZ|nr:hypothetical protein E2562_016294 [Oryza meyeriana var. granulata]